MAVAGAIRCKYLPNGQWWRPVASSVAMDLLHQAMCTSRLRRIAMAIETAGKGRVFFNMVDFIIVHNHG